MDSLGLDQGHAHQPAGSAALAAVIHTALCKPATPFHNSSDTDSGGSQTLAVGTYLGKTDESLKVGLAV
jgi:hypothetical protein